MKTSMRFFSRTVRVTTGFQLVIIEFLISEKANYCDSFWLIKKELNIHVS